MKKSKKSDRDNNYKIFAPMTRTQLLLVISMSLSAVGALILLVGIMFEFETLSAIGIWIFLIPLCFYFYFRDKYRKENHANWFANQNFHVSKKIGILSIDNINKKWFCGESTEKKGIIINPTIYNFSDVISFEFIADNKSIISSRADNAALGALLLGATGAIIGSSGERTVTNEYMNIRVYVTVNSISSPNVIIPCSSFNEGKEICGLFNLMIVENKKSKSPIAPKKTIDKVSNTSSNNKMNELREFKQLLDDGIITQEEFDAKKKQLLGL